MILSMFFIQYIGFVRFQAVQCMYELYGKTYRIDNLWPGILSEFQNSSLFACSICLKF